MCEVVLNHERCWGIRTVTYLWLSLIHNDVVWLWNLLSWCQETRGLKRSQSRRMQRLESVKTVQFCIRSEQQWCCWIWLTCCASVDKRVVFRCCRLLGIACLLPLLTLVAEFDRVCRVSFGIETEDTGIRVSSNTHTSRFTIHPAIL